MTSLYGGLVQCGNDQLGWQRAYGAVSLSPARGICPPFIYRIISGFCRAHLRDRRRSHVHFKDHSEAPWKTSLTMRQSWGALGVVQRVHPGFLVVFWSLSFTGHSVTCRLHRDHGMPWHRMPTLNPSPHFGRRSRPNHSFLALAPTNTDSATRTVYSVRSGAVAVGPGVAHGFIGPGGAQAACRAALCSRLTCR